MIIRYTSNDSAPPGPCDLTTVPDLFDPVPTVSFGRSGFGAGTFGRGSQASGLDPPTHRKRDLYLFRKVCRNDNTAEERCQ